MKPYPKSELLVEPDWLAAQKPKGNSLRVIDMRSEKAYAAGHPPGACLAVALHTQAAQFFEGTGLLRLVCRLLQPPRYPG